MSVIKMAAPCLFGLESVLSGELKRIGAKNIEATDGKVTFTGDWNMLAKTNLWLRTAERVLIVLDSFRAETFEELFQGVFKIPFEEYLGKRRCFSRKRLVFKLSASQRSGLPIHHQTGCSEKNGAALSPKLVRRNRGRASNTIFYPKKYCHHFSGHFRRRAAQARISADFFARSD